MKEVLEILNKHQVQKWGYVERPQAQTYSKFKAWIEKGKHGILSYLADERAVARESISNYFPGFKSALVFAFDYSRTAKVSKSFYESSESNGLRIANYALAFKGRDYHFELRQRLSELAEDFKEAFPDMEIMHSLDTQPILERDLAMKAGLGWFGKNSMLINKDIGSYFIIGALFFDDTLELPTSDTEVDHCGSCTRCIDLCPTKAIDLETRTLIADKCISTFTIEQFKEAAAPEGMDKSNGEIFGCDICQDVCPWNKKVEKSSCDVTADEITLFKEHNDLVVDYFLSRPIEEIINDLENISNRQFRKRFEKTPLGRTGRIGLLKNLKLYR